MRTQCIVVLAAAVVFPLTLSAASTEALSITLRSGDYVAASITPPGNAGVVVYLPDGSVLRKFRAPASDDKYNFAFAAEGAGNYKLELTAGDNSGHGAMRVESVIGLDERLTAQPLADRYPSPRIEALRQQIASGNTDTAAFWRQVAAEGTPLIEPYGNNGKYRLVTFLWRATYDTRNVFVRSPLNLPELKLSDYAMRRLMNTDVWYLTLRIPAGALFEYRLSPNDPLVFDGPRTSQRAATSQADPLNPHRWSCDPERSRFVCHSSVELPGAPARTWFVKKAGVPEGTIATATFHSEIQNVDRTIAVYTPPSHKATGRTNYLLVVFDGEDYVDEDTALPTTLNNLIASSKIPPMVAVMVYSDNPPGRRLKDLLLNPEFADSMAKELVPWVREHYNVNADGARTIVTGHSAGGVASVYMALRHPEVFGNVLSQSGAVWWSPEMDLGNQDASDEPNWLARQFVVAPRSGVRFYLDAGTFEVNTSGRGTGILEANRQLRDVLLAKGYEVHYQQFVGGHDTVSWRGTLADGLIALLGSAAR